VCCPKKRAYPKEPAIDLRFALTHTVIDRSCDVNIIAPRHAYTGASPRACDCRCSQAAAVGRFGCQRKAQIDRARARPRNGNVELRSLTLRGTRRGRRQRERDATVAVSADSDAAVIVSGAAPNVLASTRSRVSPATRAKVVSGVSRSPVTGSAVVVATCT